MTKNNNRWRWGGGGPKTLEPMAAVSAGAERRIEPSQMVFQGDARNELGPSPRGAIYRKHQKTTSVETSFHKKFGTELPRLEYCRKRKPATTPGRNEFQRFASKTARENMRRQWAGYEEPKWQRMRRPSAATAITNQTEATRSQQHQH